jgi:hypothetical protein
MATLRHLVSHLAAAKTTAEAPDHDDRRQFEAFGHLVVRGLFTAEQARDIQTRFEAEFPGTAPPPEEWSEPGVHDSVHYEPGARSVLFTSFVDSAQFQQAARSLLGPRFLLLGAGAERFYGSTPWHCDWSPDEEYPLDYQLVKAVVYLDDLRKEGGLRLLPGSHAQSYRQQLESVLRRPPTGVEESYQATHGTPYWPTELNGLGVVAAAVPGAVDTATTAVDCLFFDLLGFHGSFGSQLQDGRRVLHLVLGRWPSSDAEAAVAEGHLERWFVPSTALRADAHGKAGGVLERTREWLALRREKQ